MNTKQRNYVVKINHTQGLYFNEIARFENLQKAYEYFANFDTEELQENEELELVPYEEDSLNDWTDEELMSINQPVNKWVMKSKV